MKFFVVFLILAGINAQGILLREIRSLTFRAGVFTVPGRTNSIPQLVCKGGDACGGKNNPHLITCTNIGLGATGWACVASGLSGAHLAGNPTVICEGYAFRDDDHVLPGSCNLEYRLEYDSPNIYPFALIVLMLGLALVIWLCEVRGPNPNPDWIQRRPQGLVFCR